MHISAELERIVSRVRDLESRVAELNAANRQLEELLNRITLPASLTSAWEVDPGSRMPRLLLKCTGCGTLAELPFNSAGEGEARNEAPCLFAWDDNTCAKEDSSVPCSKCDQYVPQTASNTIELSGKRVRLRESNPHIGELRKLSQEVRL